MTWITTVLPAEDENVRRDAGSQRAIYPMEYATPTHPVAEDDLELFPFGISIL
jgi:hypothetical protein